MVLRLYQLGNWKAGKTLLSRTVSMVPIVPTGELEGRQDLMVLASMVAYIVPTGELEGRQDGVR